MLNRLLEARYTGCGTEQLAYDAAGNRVSRIWNGQLTSYTYDTRNRLLSLIEEALQEGNGEQGRSNEHASVKNIRYAYDAQGNLIQEHQGEQTTSYAYDAFNRTIRVEQADGGVVQHGYDPEGLRSRIDTNGTVRHFVHDGWHVVNELDETERVQSSYIRGHEWLTQLDDQGDVAYYVNNIHGDVTHLTGQQGQILNAYSYDAFGNMLSSREQRVNPFRYAGEMQDALTGHYYLRARFYNPLIARFTQEDTYRGDGLNLYAYVANNPIRYVDPSGYGCEDKGNVHGVNNYINVNEFTEITLKYMPGMPKYQFERKAEALKKLGDEGMLVKASNPVQRDRSVTKAYRQDLINRIWSQYGKDNRDFANKLIDKITDHRKMQPDHIWELQLSGPDTVSNLKFLDSFTNEHIGMRQIWPQIRNLPTGTKIKIKIDY